MILIEKKDACTGCGACNNVCPKKAINMEHDREGFLYPQIDQLRCINCGLCKAVCHMRKDVRQERWQKDKLKIYALYHKNKDIVKSSSSGGAFWPIAEYIIQQGGIVYGAYQKSIFQVCHGRADSIEKCEKFKKSKYLESNTSSCYAKVKQDLKNGRIVLFTGTPCQIAGLYGYLGKDYNNLYTIDVVCHGVPSLRVFKKYIKEEEKKNKASIKQIVYRDKEYGWNPNHYGIYFINNKKKSMISSMNVFHGGYLKYIFLRPSCYKCRYSKLPRIGDITLADFWQYKGRLLQDNKNRGISMAVISSEKGEYLFEHIKPQIEYESVPLTMAMKSCKHLTQAPQYSKNRESFFRYMDLLPLWLLKKLFY